MQSQSGASSELARSVTRRPAPTGAQATALVDVARAPAPGAQTSALVVLTGCAEHPLPIIRRAAPVIGATTRAHTVRPREVIRPVPVVSGRDALRRKVERVLFASPLAHSSNSCSTVRVRWSGQEINGEQADTLPGLARLNNLVRTVRTPDFAYRARAALRNSASTCGLVRPFCPGKTCFGRLL